MLAPTERSMPATSSTKVMPMAMMAICAAWVRMLMKLIGVRKRGERLAKTASSTRNRSSGAFCSSSRRRRAALLMPRAPTRAAVAHRGPEDLLAVEVGAVDEAADLAVAHHHDPVAHADQLLDLRGDHQDGGAVGRELVDDLVDLELGADVDAAGGLVQDEEPRPAQQPLADHHLLLVAAGEVLGQRADQLLRAEMDVAAHPRRPRRRASAGRSAGPRARRSPAARPGRCCRPGTRPSGGPRAGGPRSGRPCRARSRPPASGRSSASPSTSMLPAS